MSYLVKIKYLNDEDLNVMVERHMIDDFINSLEIGKVFWTNQEKSYGFWTPVKQIKMVQIQAQEEVPENGQGNEEEDNGSQSKVSAEDDISPEGLGVDTDSVHCTKWDTKRLMFIFPINHSVRRRQKNFVYALTKTQVFGIMMFLLILGSLKSLWIGVFN